jgi:hypothetical protein
VRTRSRHGRSVVVSLSRALTCSVAGVRIIPS